ncbi:MAG: methyltransferase domain-containing protein [Candidatus Peribacteraceae bacterium]|nr:methyltransferase domain-containing protein [Candidatus Peribacteraceae bacterium]
MDLSLLACPQCQGTLVHEGDALRCAPCGKNFSVENGVPIFIPKMEQRGVESHRGRTPVWKKMLRGFSPPHHSLYFGTLCSSQGEGRELKDLLRAHKEAKILNVGSLSKDLKKLHPNIINLDICFYPNIDVVADAHALPFRSGSIDIVLFKNVIEHIRSPEIVMVEIHRVLKVGGILYIKLPFLQPFHAVPDDYQRYTESGMQELLREYDCLTKGISVGPGSMLAWIVREVLAIMTSFRSQRLYRIGIFIWGWLTFWLKYADILFWGNPLSGRVSSAFLGTYRKK